MEVNTDTVTFSLFLYFVRFAPISIFFSQLQYYPQFVHDFPVYRLDTVG